MQERAKRRSILPEWIVFEVMNTRDKNQPLRVVCDLANNVTLHNKEPQGTRQKTKLPEPTKIRGKE